MRTALFCIISLIITTTCAIAQDVYTFAIDEKNIFLELGGSGGLGSINYERTLWDVQGQRKIRDNCGGKPIAKHVFTWRAGFGTSPIDKNNGWVLVFPAMVNVVYGLGNHKLEAGAGIALSVTTKGGFYMKSPAMIGYRFSPEDKRYFLRVNYTPIIGWWFDYQWQHWAGISLGYHLSHEKK